VPLNILRKVSVVVKAGILQLVGRRLASPSLLWQTCRASTIAIGDGEDNDICRRLQLGWESGAYYGGYFAPYWDEGVVNFHKQVAYAPIA
jgi:hypothetical protein